MNTIFYNLMYQLKKSFGSSIDYVQLEKSEVNHQTGSREIVRKVLPLPCVLLPQSQMRKFVQDIGYLAANKNFTYGGLNDFLDVSFILDPNDLPSEFNRDLDGYITYGHRRYEKVSFEYLQDFAIVLRVKGVQGAYPFAQVRACSCDKLELAGRVVVELN